MNRTILNKALKVLHDRKTAAVGMADANYKIALEDPQIEAVDKKMRALTIEISKKEFWHKDSSIEVEQLKNLDNERQTLLLTKFGKNFSIKPKYTCSKCSDTGFVDHEPCSCLKEVITSILLDLSGTAKNLSSFENANFDVFDEVHRDKIQLAYKKMQEWCEKYKTTKYKNIGLFGNTGVGKTFLTEAMANKLISQGAVINFTSSFSLSNLMMNYHKAIDEAKASILSPVLECDVLIIDDLGTEPIYKNVTLEYLYLIVNERATSGKSTIFSTNLSIPEFRDRYGERILSRLLNKQTSLTINLAGEDIRLKKNN